VPAPVPYANLTNPQTLNLYAMVSDNPETFADLDGHICGTVEGSDTVGCTTGPLDLWTPGVPSEAQKTGDGQPMSDSQRAEANEQSDERNLATVNSTSYKSRNEAALAAEKRAIEMTNKKNGVPPRTDWEFGGWVLRKGKHFYYTEPLQGRQRGQAVPKGFTKVAGYHTHPDGGPWGEGLSGYPGGDVGWSVNHPGALWLYTSV